MHDRLTDKVFEFIRLQGIFADNRAILVAVSGGADSICLLHVLRTLRVPGRLEAPLVCCHINHHLRGTDSDTDERFVVEQTTEMGLPVVVRSVDVPSHAKTNRQSIETAARQLRLAALEEIARDRRCEWIATGHQKNDNAETVVQRLRRGTGFRGLAGIRPIRRLGEGLSLVRPLLCVTREEVIRYLHERNLPWREDHTNADVAYTRNYIRRRLLPLLQQESEALLVEELADLAASAGKLHDRAIEEAQQAWTTMAQADDDAVRIDASGLASLPELIAVELIRRALMSLGCGERDLTAAHYQRVLGLARSKVQAKHTSLPSGFIARLESRQLVLRPGVEGSSPKAHDAPSPLNIPGRTAFADVEIDARILPHCEIEGAEITGDKGPFCEYLDWDRIKPPVVARPRRRGDRFHPLGMDTEKKVGKFLTAAKAPRRSRDRTIVFADRDRILWICPVRIAEPVKITDETRLVLELTVRNT
ncbi:MAG TPA: tRNA lysidine(34) synthetase TilS [Sedimentisphaerales bacterium]|nr:tRNA lysidine(34) synthetase TilS [Sedimentisphaerales bacterium]